MSETISREQALQGLLSLGVNVQWDAVDGDDFQKMVIEDPIRAGKELTRFLQNGARVQVIGNHVIDCDADPFVPQDWSVEDHRKVGQVVWNPAEIALHLESEQKTRTIKGCDLLKKLVALAVLNANVLDYLLAHPELIPEEWKRKACIYFWGTIYRAYAGLCVRCLDWNDGGWRWSYFWLDGDWIGQGPAAVFAK